MIHKMSSSGALSRELVTFTRSGHTAQGAVLAAAAAEPPSTRSDFLYTFLALAQNLWIDFLPVTWQPELDAIGKGATAEIRQSLVNLQTGFAFKRFLNIESESEDIRIFRALIAEVSILGHFAVRDDPNILQLEGVCWNIGSGDGRGGDDQMAPVLVFEKTQFGDLWNFMANIGRSLSFEERLDICADVGNPVRYMHTNLGIIHGDIKPQNVLVFEGGSNKYNARVTDFGYSAQFVNDEEMVRLPFSEPWCAPEHHHREITIAQAKKMDVYSFGMFCLWVLFYNSPEHPNRDFFMDLKTETPPAQIAHELILQMDPSSSKRQENLIQFFEMSLATEPRSRSPDIEELLRLVTPHR
jgi:serine/threonine protein kinase